MSNETTNAISSLDEALANLHAAKALQGKPGALTARVVAEVGSGLFLLNYGELIRSLLQRDAVAQDDLTKKAA